MHYSIFIHLKIFNDKHEDNLWIQLNIRSPYDGCERVNVIGISSIERTTSNWIKFHSNLPQVSFHIQVIDTDIEMEQSNDEDVRKLAKTLELGNLNKFYRVFVFFSNLICFRILLVSLVLSIQSRSIIHAKRIRSIKQNKCSKRIWRYYPTYWRIQECKEQKKKWRKKLHLLKNDLNTQNKYRWEFPRENSLRIFLILHQMTVGNSSIIEMKQFVHYIIDFWRNNYI